MSSGDVSPATVVNLNIDEDRFSGNVASLAEFHGHRNCAWCKAKAAYLTITACLKLLLSHQHINYTHQDRIGARQIQI